MKIFLIFLLDTFIIGYYLDYNLRLKTVKLHYKLSIFVLLIISATPLFSADVGDDVAGTLFHHVLNGTEITVFPGIAPITLPFGISVHGFMIFLAVVLIAGLFLLTIKKGVRKPVGMAVFLESIVLFVRDDIVYPVMGEKKGEGWLVFFSTQFLFISTINLLGLIPSFKSATGNINVTIAMALMVFLLIFIIGIKNLGLLSFFKNLYPEGASLPIGIFVSLLELMGLFTKSIVLSLRLFANMFAGHLAILSFLVLIFVINPYFGFVAVPFAVFTYTLEVLVALLQAFVFTLLSCIFISMASTPEGE